jgi:hypothetical protein
MHRLISDFGARRTLDQRYGPNQPRVPPGSPGGGRWSNGGGRNRGRGTQRKADPEPGRPGEREGSGGITIASWKTLAECLAQSDRDLFQCRPVGLGLCYPQATVRWIASEEGHPIPPSNY